MIRKYCPPRQFLDMIDFQRAALWPMQEGDAVLDPINPPGAAFPGISQAMRIRRGDLLVLSGHVPVDADGQLVTGDFATQLDAVFKAISRTLSAAGVGFEAVARLTIYVVAYEPGMLATLREVRSRYISASAPPASVFVSVAALYDPRVRVEVEGLAVIPADA
jgi:enamine deaminase RidA (YjgF/YER057c/UK114 family)